MDLNLIKKLVRMVDTSGVTDLEVEENGLRVKIAKKVRQNTVVTQAQLEPPAAAAPAVQPLQETAPAVKEEETPKEETAANIHEIRSPIVGTFYRAPAPDADPYVQIGDTVSPGSTLCIVEAMKLMNEIESDVAGKVVKILAEDSKPVEYNQPLFLIEIA